MYSQRKKCEYPITNKECPIIIGKSTWTLDIPCWILIIQVLRISRMNRKDKKRGRKPAQIKPNNKRQKECVIPSKGGPQPLS